VSRRGRRWRRGVRPAVVAALASVVAGYFANIVSGGNHSIVAIAGFGIAVVAFLGSVWWDSVHQLATTSSSAVELDQQVGPVRDGTVTGVDTDDGNSGDYTLRQRVKDAERTDVIGIRIRHVPPRGSQE